MGNSHKKYLLPILTGGLLGLALNFPHFWFLALVGFLPLLIFFFREKTGRAGFWGGVVAGATYFLILFNWLWALYPPEALGIASKFTGFLVIGFIYLCSAGLMAIFWGISGGLAQKLTAKKYQLLVWALLFVLTEWLRAWGFGLFWTGSQSSLGPHWTLGNPAYLVAPSAFFRQLASMGGIYFVTLVILLVNISIYRIFKATSLKNTLPKIRTLALVLIIGFILFTPDIPAPKSHPTIQVSIIQTQNEIKENYTPSDRLLRLEEQLRLVGTLRETPSSKIIVFPENSDFFRNLPLVINPDNLPNFFDQLFDDPVTLIDHSRIETGSETVSKTIVLDSKSGIVATSDKRLLTPGGEYLPYLLNWVARSLSPTARQNLDAAHFYSQGENNFTPKQTEAGQIGTLVCSEMFSPQLSRALAKNGAELIVIQSSTGLFRGNRSLINQDLNIVRMRAAEQGRSVVFSTNFGLSYFLGSSGELLKISPDSAPQILTEQVPLNTKQTWYNRTGDKPLLVVILGILMLIFLNNHRSKKAKDE